jgi:hypothetical protein
MMTRRDGRAEERMADGRVVPRWLKWGCFGCLGAGAVLVMVAVGVVAVVSSQDRRELDTRALTHALPVGEVEAPPSPDAAGAAPPGSPAAPAGAAGRVVLRLSQGGFILDRGEPGEPLRVEARYDPESYELREEWLTPEGSPWTYELSFHSKVQSSWLRGLLEMLEGTTPEVRVFLPPDAPIALELEVEQAGTEADLGGLWLTEASIEVTQGGIKLAVSEPLRAPLERLSIRGAMAGVEAASIGNASPRRLELEANMGGVELDLGGQWVADATISLAAKMAGVEVTLPDDVNIVGVEERLPTGSEPEIRRPTLTFDGASGMGGIEFVKQPSRGGAP